jgi:hypothetical protein
MPTGSDDVRLSGVDRKLPIGIGTGPLIGIHKGIPEFAEADEINRYNLTEDITERANRSHLRLPLFYLRQGAHRLTRLGHLSRDASNLAEGQ